MEQVVGATDREQGFELGEIAVQPMADQGCKVNLLKLTEVGDGTTEPFRHQPEDLIQAELEHEGAVEPAQGAVRVALAILQQLFGLEAEVSADEIESVWEGDKTVYPGAGFDVFLSNCKDQNKPPSPQIQAMASDDMTNTEAFATHPFCVDDLMADLEGYPQPCRNSMLRIRLAVNPLAASHGGSTARCKYNGT